MGDPTRVVGRRAIAYILDSFVSVVLFWVVITLMGGSIEADPGSVEGVRIEGDGSAIATAAVFPFLYWIGTGVLLQGFLGWTPGKLFTGLRLAGWDGRPPGVWRAFVHSLVVQVASALQCLGWLFLGAFITFHRYHRHPGDMLAGTYVIDAPAQGRLLLRTDTGIQVGPPAVTREDVAKAYGAEAASAIMAPSVQGRPTSPVFDKARGTYVVWRPKSEQWLEFDQSSNQWRPLA